MNSTVSCGARADAPSRPVNRRHPPRQRPRPRARARRKRQEERRAWQHLVEHALLGDEGEGALGRGLLKRR
jgi:hypothetical protein